MEIKNNFYKQTASGRLDFIMSGKQQKSTITTNNTGLCEECASGVCFSMEMCGCSCLRGKLVRLQLLSECDFGALL